jgi:signal transduction histidine kinase/CheY-like chemotaxis protein
VEKKKILVVEDEKVLLDLYASVLLRQGRDALYQVMKAENIDQALDLLQHNTFDLVLTDYHLPAEDGITLMKKIKAQTPQTIAILISGYLSHSIIQSALQAGAYTCLKKPCSISTIVETIQKALAQGDGETGAKEKPAGSSIPASADPCENDDENPEPAAAGGDDEAKDFFVLALDRDSRIVFSDRHFPALLEVKWEEIRQRRITEFLHSYFLQYLAKQEMDFIQFAKLNTDKQVTLDFVVGEGKIRHPLVLEFVKAENELTQNWEVLAVGMDMGKRLELNRLIEFERESSRQLRAGQFDMVITVDKDYRIKTINNTCLLKLKAKQRELVGKLFSELLAKPRDRQSFEQAVVQAQALKDVYNLRLDLAFQKENVPVLVNVSAVRDSFNDELGYVIVLRDIERQLKMEATLRSVERMQALGQLAAGTAHQINNYTNAIMGSSDLLEERVSESLAEKPQAMKDALQLLKIIQESIQKLTALTQHLTAFARAQQPPVISAGDVNCVIRDILALINTHVTKKSISIETELDEKLPSVYFSPVHLEQAALNIIMNAIDAVAQIKGHITISTYREPEWVCIRVKDNGPGIPEEIRGQIFEAFVTTKPPGVGTGLGLNVARDVVESIKGTILVDSDKDRGTTMTIKIPILNNERRARGFAAETALSR